MSFVGQPDSVLHLKEYVETYASVVHRPGKKIKFSALFDSFNVRVRACMRVRASMRDGV